MARDERSVALHAIIDRGDDTVVIVGAHAPAIVLLSKWIVDTSYVLDIPPRKTREIRRASAKMFPEWSWNFNTWTFKKSGVGLVTDAKRERSILADRKAKAITRAIYWTNRMRARVDTGLSLQNAIYAEKERQARMLMEGGFDENLLRECFYVSQHAEMEHIPVKQAAEEILLHARLDHEYLARTEAARLLLFKKIRLATTVDEVDTMMETYREYGRV